MYRSTCEYGAPKAPVETPDSGSEGDSSKENSLVDGQNNLLSTPVSSKTGGGSPSNVGSPWGHTLTPRSGSPGHVRSGVAPDSKLSNRTVMASSPNMSLSPAKPNVPWNDLSFAAEVLSPGFTGRIVRAAHASSPRITREGRRQYPTAQERYVRAGVMPNVRLGGRTKAVLTPRRTPTSPLIPLSRSPSAFSSSLSSDFLSSATPRMPDIRSVASVLEPVSTSSECVRDPTSVQAVVAALQQAQAGKGVKRGSCYMEAEDLSKRQRCSTPGNNGSSVSATAIPVNYSRDYIEDSQNHGSNGNANGGGEKRALDLSPQGSPQQISPENKRRCVLDPMRASLSSSKYLDFSRLQGSGRDTPYSMYDSRHDTDSESNRSVDSGRSKASEQSLHQQTSEATVGDSCVISPGPSERDLSDRSGSHTPQSTRGESWNSVAGNGGTANTSRTSTPRNPTPPHHNHVITLEAYKAEKTKSQQRLKKMLGMLFHVSENEETQSSKSGSSTPVPSVAPTKPAVEIVVPSTSSSSASTQDDKGVGVTAVTSVSSKVPAESSTPSTSTVAVTEAEDSTSDVTTTYTFSLKPSSSSSSNVEKTASGVSEEKTKEPSVAYTEGDSNVSVSAVIKLPPAAGNDTKQPTLSFSGSSSHVAQTVPAPVTSAEVTKPSTLVHFLKTTVPPRTSSPGVSETVAANPLLQSRLSMPSQILVTPSTPLSEMNPLFNIPTHTGAGVPAGETSLRDLTAGKVSDTTPVSSSTSAGFTFSAAKPPSSPFNFGMSSASNILVSDGSSTITTSLAKSASSPFTVVSSNAEKIPSTMLPTTTGALVSSSDSKSTGGLSGTFSFGNAAPISLPVSIGFSNPAIVPPTSAVSSAPNFTFPSGAGATATPQSDLFMFGSTKTAAPPAGPPPSYPTPGNTSQSSLSPGMMFAFGVTTQGATSTTTSTVLSQQLSTPQSSVLFKAPPPTTTPATSGFPLGPTFGAPATSTSASVGAPPQNIASATSVASSLQPPPAFNFGQPLASQAAATTTAASGFNFSSASQTAGAPPVFQFGTTTASSQDNKAQAGQLFPSSVVSSQGSIPSSSPFAFGSAGNMGTPSANPTAASPFAFGAPKTDNPAPPAFGSAESSVKTTTQAGFNFSSTPAATTNAFGSIAPTTTANTFSSATNTASAPSAGFNFGATATPASGFSFGASNKTPATTTASSPFAFGSSATKSTSFGAPPTSTASPFNFGSNTVPTSTFGSNPGQGFGAQTTSAPTFGTATPSFGSSTTAVSSPFNSNNAFGATSPAPSFGGASFGGAASGGQSGTTPNPFGSQPGSLTFGTPAGNPPSFGTPGNATAPAPTFGTPSNAAPAAPTFGTPSNAATAAPAFGTPTNTAPAAPAFGSSTAAPATGGFGATQPASFGSSFGAASTSTGNNSAAVSFQFGQGAANPPPPSFGMGAAAAPGGAVFQFGTATASPFNAALATKDVATPDGFRSISPFEPFGNPGTGPPRRPRNRASRRHR